jgi:hypothetical protein
MLAIVLAGLLAIIGCGIWLLRLRGQGAGIGGTTGKKIFLVEFVAIVAPYFAMISVVCGAIVVVGASDGVASLCVSLLVAAAAATPMT